MVMLMTLKLVNRIEGFDRKEGKCKGTITMGILVCRVQMRIKAMIIDNVVYGVDVKIRTVSLLMEVTIDESEVKFRKLACAESMLMKDADLRNTSM